MKRFAKTIVKVLLAYADICKKEFPNYVSDEKKVSILLSIYWPDAFFSSWELEIE